MKTARNRRFLTFMPIFVDTVVPMWYNDWVNSCRGNGERKNYEQESDNRDCNWSNGAS